MPEPRYIEATGDTPKVAPTLAYFSAIYAGLKTAEEYARDLDQMLTTLSFRIEAAYDDITAQIENELDVLGGDGNSQGQESVERILRVVRRALAETPE